MGGGKMVIREPKEFPRAEGGRLGLGLLLPSSSPSPPSVSTDAVESLSAGLGTMTMGEGPEENSDGTGIPRGETGWDEYVHPSGWDEDVQVQPSGWDEYVQPSGWDDDVQVQPSGWEDDAKPEKDSAPAAVPRREGKGEQVQYPQRVGEPDCSFYLKFGSCRFGTNCRFNHPPRRKRNKGKSKPNQLADEDLKGGRKVREKGQSKVVKTGNYEVQVIPNMEELGLGLPSPSCSSHDAASADAFSAESKNLLQEEKLDIGGDLEYPGSDENANLKDSMSSKEGKSHSFHFLHRPDKPDCSFYLKTGNCKYGSNCKFNHPRAKENKVKSKKQSEPIQVAKEKESKSSTEKPGRAEGKYYSMPGVSKFGKSSKHTPLQENTEPSPVELNFLGLPLRPGERECPYYMRSGGCNFATNCRYHHPDPIVVGGQDTLSGFQNGASPQHHPSGATALQMTSWPLPMASNEPVPLFDAYSSGFSPLPPQGFYPNPEWNGYQVPVTPWHPPNMSRTVVSHQPVQFDEYPERPGQTECHYFMKNGNCKFKSACRFHHPKTHLQKWA